ncbi:MAG TPA: multicopper oxidase family protein [Propionibacteriaceae bacterium]|nr:multicopper oxidase family protein [Propionibacteriaceae bacterium]
MSSPARIRRPLRLVLPVLATVALVAPLAWMWQASRMPGVYSVMEMGYLDYGGGVQVEPNVAGHGGHGEANGSGHHLGPGRLITDLVADPARPADVRVELVTRQEVLTIGGRSIAGFTVNGTSPGPEIRVRQGQLIEIHLRNESVSAGVALHWHGVDVPNAMDGVAGVTQDAVPIGSEFSYRFVADRAGSFWYHSHQVSNPQVAGGLLGSLVVTPQSGIAQHVDVSAIAHSYGGVRTINGKAEDLRVPARPGQQIRVRVTNTDNGPMKVWASGSYRLLATDGAEVNQPTEVSGRTVTLTAGARADIQTQAPEDGSAVRLQLSKATAVIIGPEDADVQVPPQPGEELDLLTYGSPAPLGFDPAQPTRRFDYSIGRRPGFVKGRPGMWWSINGHLYPNVPMFVVREGDVASVHIENRSSEVHPMHLHGHHMVVLARNGVAATGSPWWVDSLNVAANQSYDVAFIADNPGIWMDHCHNLKHAADGMVAHLMYQGFDTPYRIAGPADNRPE